MRLNEGQESDRRRIWKDQPERVKAPYPKLQSSFKWLLSTAGHVEPCGNLPGPSGKAKYSLATDSEPVP